MKNTRKQICVRKHNLVNIYRTVWEDNDRYYIKDNGELIEVFKNRYGGFSFEWQFKE